VANFQLPSTCQIIAGAQVASLPRPRPQSKLPRGIKRMGAGVRLEEWPTWPIELRCRCRPCSAIIDILRAEFGEGLGERHKQILEKEG